MRTRHAGRRGGLVRAQASLGLAPPKAADAIAAAAATPGRFDPRDLALRARAGANPVIALVHDLTEAVAGTDAEAAAHVHRGATSQDILDTALMTVSARAVDHVLTDLARVARHLHRLALAHRDTTTAGRTLTQHAVPTTFGLKAAGWRSLVLDAYDRLAAVRGRLPAQLGAPRAPWPRSPPTPGPRARPPLGRRHPGPRAAAVRRVRGADRARRAHAALARAAHPGRRTRRRLALASGALGKLAADVLVLSRTEIGEVAEGTGGGRPPCRTRPTPPARP